MRKFWMSLALFVTAVLSLGLRGLPDIAPPQYPPGGDPDPGAETQVQMLTEQVVIEVPMNPDPEAVDARVDAVFHMRNQGAASEQFEVYFPAQCRGDEAPIQDLQAEVNGQPVPVRRESRPQSGDARCHEWFVFPVTFPPGQEVTIRVRYPLHGVPGARPFVDFRYILATGQGWWGPIHEGTITLRLPYPARPENAWVTTSQRLQVAYEGPTLRVSFTDLEPTEQDNLVFTLVVPSLWQPVQQAEEALQARPNDGEAWGQLALALKRIVLKGGGKAVGTEYQARLLPRIFEGYERAVTLLPDDPLWHLGYAEILWYCYAPGVWAFLPDECPGYSQEEGLRRAIFETYQAYQLAPQHPQVRQMLQTLAPVMEPYVLVQEDGQVVFAALTQTPGLLTTPFATLTPTPERSATSTPTPPSQATPPTREPASTPTATPTSTTGGAAASTSPVPPNPEPEPQGGLALGPLFLLGLCILCGAALLALGLGGLLLKRKRANLRR